MHTYSDETKRPFLLKRITFGFVFAGLLQFINGYTPSLAAMHPRSTGGLVTVSALLIGILCITLAYGLWIYNDTARKGAIVLNYIGAAANLIQLIAQLARMTSIVSPATIPAVLLIAPVIIGLEIAINRYLQSDQILELFEINDRRKNQNWRQHNR